MSYNKFTNYESWVDNIINSHKEKLQNLKSDKSSSFIDNLGYKTFSDINSGNLVKNNFENRNIYQSSSSSDLKQNLNLSENFRNNKLEKLLNSLLEENAELKIKLQNKEYLFDNLQNKFNCTDKDFKINSNLFFERENDLVETIKLLDFDNKRLEEKIVELKKDLDKNTKELNLIKNENYINQIIPRVSNSPISSSKIVDEYKNDNELQFRFLKLDKVIDIFVEFFDKYDLNVNKNMKDYVKNFDYENLKNLLKEFENNINNHTSDGILANSLDKIINNHSPIARKDNYSNLIYNNYIGKNNSKNNLSTSGIKNITSIAHDESNTNKNMNESEIPMISKLEKRLKELEDNISNLITNRTNSNLENNSSNNNKLKTTFNNKLTDKKISTTPKKTPVSKINNTLNKQKISNTETKLNSTKK